MGRGVGISVLIALPVETEADLTLQFSQWRHMSLIFYNCHSFCYRMTLILKILVEVSAYA